MTKTEALIVKDMIQGEAWVSPVLRNQLTGLLKMYTQGIPMNIRFINNVFIVSARTEYNSEQSNTTMDSIQKIEGIMEDNNW